MDEHNLNNNKKIGQIIFLKKNWLQMVFSLFIIIFVKLFTYLEIYDNENFHKLKT